MILFLVSRTGADLTGGQQRAGRKPARAFQVGASPTLGPGQRKFQVSYESVFKFGADLGAGRPRSAGGGRRWTGGRRSVLLLPPRGDGSFQVKFSDLLSAVHCRSGAGQMVT